MAQKSRLTSILSGIAGEYFVAAELSRRGYVASLTLRNTRGMDILASNIDATRSVGIQVKTNQGRGRAWMLNQKAEKDTAENLFYVFIRLNDLAEPQCHIVPRAVVAKYIRRSHKAWSSTRGRRGQRHKDTTIRKFPDKNDKYLNRWDLLGLGDSAL